MRFTWCSVVVVSALALAAACSSFAARENGPSPIDDGGSDGGRDGATEPRADGAPDADAGLPRDAGPLWDGGCIIGVDSVCDSFDNSALGASYTIVNVGGSIGVEDPPVPPWPPATSSRSLVTSIFAPEGGRVYVRKNDVQLGYRFGMALRFGVDDHPGAAVVGPRIAAADGPDGDVPTIGILFGQQIGVQQTGPGIKELLNLGDLKRQFWHSVIVEVRRDPTAPGGRGWIYATLDGEAPRKALLLTPLTRGSPRVGVVSTGTSVGLRIDDSAFINDP